MKDKDYILKKLDDNPRNENRFLIELLTEIRDCLNDVATELYKIRTH